MEQFKGKPRLPKFAVPNRYDLTLKPDLSACKFTGSVEIDIEIVEQTKFLVLNAVELVIHGEDIFYEAQHSQQRVWPSNVVLFEEDEILVLDFDDVLPMGMGILGIEFSGTLNDKMKGFYRSTYELNGEKKNAAVTQFEPVDARRCFPCWDEPAAKAIFQITLEVPSELIALSNMPVILEKPNGHLKTISFEESPIMSTYLVAIVVGLFDYIEDISPDGTGVRVYCQVGKTEQGRFALDVAVKTLNFYTDYFAVPYSLPKLDMIAIPDFAYGAMENYGLVTYCETALLYDEHHSAAANKQRVATVVAHELAHQWFGNLVTMEWWTHLWLTEGFATWISYLATDSLFPEWNSWTQFLVETTQGLKLDGLAESHPIEVEVNHAHEIDEIFDAISYKKGASLIRMLQNYLGAETFQRSLALYIKRYACMNAKTEDLWAVLSQESGEPVNNFMDTWTKQKGYPVIYVKGKDKELEFEQEQFLSSGLPGDGLWIVPITVCCGSYDARKNFLLQLKTGKLNISELLDSNRSKSFWIKVNVEQAGFYRVKYDDGLDTKLRTAIEANCLSTTDRFDILDDSYALCMACKQTSCSLLSLMDAYREELDYTVLSHLMDISSKVAWLASDAIPNSLNELKQLFINLLQFSAGKLGWDCRSDEGHLDAMLRGEILSTLASFGHDITIKEAVRRFHAFLDDRNTPLLPADTRKAAYVAVMRNVTASDRSGYESLLRIYRETDLSQEKVRILSSLASSPDPDIVLEALNFLLSSEVRTQDAIFGLAQISRQGRETSWKWLMENWEHIAKTWGSGHLMTRFISAIVSQFSSDEKVAEIEAFFASRTNPSIARTVKQSIEQVRINARLIKNMRSEQPLAMLITKLAHSQRSVSRVSWAGYFYSVFLGIKTKLMGLFFPNFFRKFF